MSLVFSTVPQITQPVYNPIYFRLLSNQITQPNFSYVFDIYTGTTGTTLVNRERLPARPDGTCIFSPAGILESLLGFDIPVNTIGGVGQTYSMTPYYVYFGEEYGLLTTGVTTYANQVFKSGYTWTSVLNYEQVPSYNYTAYTPNDQVIYGANYLTFGPAVVNVRENDRESLSFLNLSGTTSGAPWFWIVNVYQKSGSTTQAQLSTGVATGTTAKNTMMHIGVGPWNLNNIPSSLVTGTTQPIIDFNRDAYYDVTVYSAGGPLTFPTPLFSARTYNCDTTCTKYTPVRLMWLNSLGGFDYFNFILVSRETINLQRNQYKRNLPYNYTIGQAGFTVSDIQSRESLQVTSDWMTDTQSQWMKELLKSKAVYELRSDGSYLPVILNMDSVEIKKSVNDKLINYEFSYTYAYKVGTMRG